LKHASLKPFIKCLKELNLDFFGILTLIRIAVDDVTFSLENTDSWYNIYNPEAPAILGFEISNMAKRIASVMFTLGEYPYVRHSNRPTPFSTASDKSICSELAVKVQSELDLLCRNDPAYPPPSSHKRAILLIVDRSIDVLSPFMHEFSYQAMAADLVGFKNGKYM
jgi:syntaxin-binding protein 1